MSHVHDDMTPKTDTGVPLSGNQWETTDSSSPISHVAEGMKVVDSAGEEIGSVEFVRMGDPTAATTGAEPPHNDGFLDDLARAFGRSDEPDVPDTIRDRLLRLGYIKVDGKGILQSDLYVAADLVASVTQDHVRLAVSKDQLIEEGS